MLRRSERASRCANVRTSPRCRMTAASPFATRANSPCLPPPAYLANQFRRLVGPCCAADAARCTLDSNAGLGAQLAALVDCHLVLAIWFPFGDGDGGVAMALPLTCPAYVATARSHVSWAQWKVVKNMRRCRVTYCMERRRSALYKSYHKNVNARRFKLISSVGRHANANPKLESAVVIWHWLWYQLVGRLLALS